MHTSKSVNALLLSLLTALASAPATAKSSSAPSAPRPSVDEAALVRLLDAAPAAGGRSDKTDAPAPHGAGTGGGTVAEEEPNDGVPQATFARDVPFTGRGSVSSDDTDLFAVDVEAGQPLRAWVFASIVGSQLDPELFVYYLGADGNAVQIGFNDDASGLDSYFSFVAPVTGRLVFRVEAAVAGSAGAYRLYVAPGTDGSSVLSVEPNDAQSQVPATALPALALVSVDAPGDVDWFAFQGEAGQQLVVDVNAEEFGSNMDSVAELYDATGHLLVANDDGEEQDHDSLFNVKLPYTGLYGLRLRDYRASAGGTGFFAIVSLSLQDGSASPDVLGVKRNPAGAVKRILGANFADALTVELDGASVATLPVPNKPNVRKIKPPQSIAAGTVVTVVNGNGRRSNPYVVE